MINFSSMAFKRSYSAPSKRPLLNSPWLSSTTGATRYPTWNSNNRRFMNFFKSSVELMAPIRTIASDVVGDRPLWFASNGAKLSATEEMKAKKFWRDNRGKETAKEVLMDGLVTGQGFWWIGKPDPSLMSKVSDSFTSKFKEKLEVKEFNKLKVKMDEELRMPRRFDHVASTTMRVLADSHDVTGYEQTVSGDYAVFSPEEIIHYKYMSVDGDINGFTPILPLVNELVLMFYVKGNMKAYLENGGNPDYLFTLENEKVGQPGYERFEEQLRSFKSLEGRHGTLLATGKTVVEQLNKERRDLEYKELALFITSNIAYAFGIPITRIPYLIGTSATKGDNGGMAERGYWNLISEIQDTVEDLLNSQLFEQKGWSIKFNRKYKQDDMIDAQTMQFNVDSLNNIQALLNKKGKSLTTEKVLQVIGFSDEDLEELSDQEKSAMNTENGLNPDGSARQNQNPKQATNSARKNTVDGQKRTSANSSSGKSSMS